MRVTGPLAPQVLDELELALRKVDQPASARQLAVRLAHLAEILASGPPVRELAIRSAALALACAAECARDDRLKRIGNPSSPQPERVSPGTGPNTDPSPDRPGPTE